jgi:hypothetical protein
MKLDGGIERVLCAAVVRYACFGSLSQHRKLRASGFGD